MLPATSSISGAPMTSTQSANYPLGGTQAERDRLLTQASNEGESPSENSRCNGGVTRYT
jgi:hypothetical protein